MSKPQVSDEQLKRMKRLNLAGEISPDVWFPNHVVDVVEKPLGKGMGHTAMQVKRFFDAGLEPAFGSDWGSSARSYDLMASLEALLTRKDPWGENGETVLGPDQVVNLETALRMMTINGAKVMQHEHERGSLEVGKYADMVVLSEHLFDVVKAGRPDKISDAKVLQTIFEGEVSFAAG